MRLPRELVRASQRERLLVAMIELVDREGYPRVTVGTLTEHAHVSRSAFYELFESLENCLVTAYHAHVARMSAWVVSAFNTPGLDTEERLRAANEAFVNIVSSWPAAARVCVGDILTAGPRAREVQQETIGWTRRVIGKNGASNAGARRAAAPLCRATALLGGARRTLYENLRETDERELTAVTMHLLEWARQCSGAPEMTPGGRRRSTDKRTGSGRRANTSATRRTSVAAGQAQRAEEDDFADARRRILDAVLQLAEQRGYREMTYRDIAERAKVSYNTFYKHFASKEEAFLCVCRETHERAIKPAQEALQKAGDWPQGLCLALGAYLDELAADTGCTRVGSIEILTLGRPGLTHLDTCAASIEDLLRPGMEIRPDVPPSLLKGLAGSVEETVRHYTAKRSLHQLPGVLPELSRVLLTPFLGAPRAMETAREALAV